MGLIMLDSISLSELAWAYANQRPQAFAGYVGGNWPTYSQLQTLYKATGLHLLSIAVFASQDAECLDIESGDATNAQAPDWFRRQRARGVWKPVLYTSASNANALIAAMSAQGISRDQYRLWSAHYTFSPHICGPAGCGYPQADGTQWTDRAYGHNIDASLLSDSFFGTPSPAARKVEPVYGQITTDKLDIALPDGVTRIRFFCSVDSEISVDLRRDGQRGVKLALGYNSTRTVTVPAGVHGVVVHVTTPAHDGTPISYVAY